MTDTIFAELIIGKKGAFMSVVYESEILAKEAKAMLPFQISVEEDIEGEVKTVRVIRKLFAKDNCFNEVKTELLMESVWKE